MSDISILGVPFDDASSFLKGCREAPDAIRHAFHSASANYFTESETDLGGHKSIQDLGNIAFKNGDDPLELILQSAEKALADGSRLLSLGGDHSITYPLLKAHAKRSGKLNLIQFDAHPDLYAELDGNRYSHACPFARAHEDGLINQHVQVGIRTMTAHQREQADRFGVNVVTMRDLPEAVPAMDGPVYVTIDLDVLDPAFIPGISHYEPGGMSVRELLTMIQKLPDQITGADIVELNPTRDSNGMSAMVAAKIMKELLDRMLSPPPAG